MVTVQRASQAPQFRIFHVMPGHSVEINGLTISGGHITDDNGGGILNDNSTLTIAHCTVNGNAIVSGSVANNFGGGIYNSGTMTLNQVIVNNNFAVFGGGGPDVPSGGGISNTGTMIIIAGTVQSNLGFWSAGGIYNTGMLTITGSTILNNQTGDPGHFGGSGGGIINDGTMTIQDSTISGNTARGGDLQGGDGGGISGNNNTITNSTITGNSALHGGGVAGGGNIAHTTFSNNSASRDGGALYLTSPLELGNTILKAGVSGVNIFNNGGSFITHGYNISSDDGSGLLNGPGDQINTDPMLGPLQNNGGPTFTHELLTGSPAIDAGDPNFTPPPYYDQRGPVFWRMRNGRIDVGSFEVQTGTTPSPTPSPTASPTPTATATATATGTPTATVPPSPTATPSACFVYITGPDCDSVINTQPVDFSVNLSDPTDPSSVQPTDFMVNGTSADSYIISPPYLRIFFHFNTSPAVQGLNVMHIPPGAFNCSIGGTPEFTCTFTYQPSTPTPTQPPPSPTATVTSTPTPRPSPTQRPHTTPRPRPTPPPRP